MDCCGVFFILVRQEGPIFSTSGIWTNNNAQLYWLSSKIPFDVREMFLDYFGNILQCVAVSEVRQTPTTTCTARHGNVDNYQKVNELLRYHFLSFFFYFKHSIFKDDENLMEVTFEVTSTFWMFG